MGDGCVVANSRFDARRHGYIGNGLAACRTLQAWLKRPARQPSARQTTGRRSHNCRAARRNGAKASVIQRRGGPGRADPEKSFWPETEGQRRREQKFRTAGNEIPRDAPPGTFSSGDEDRQAARMKTRAVARHVAGWNPDPAVAEPTRCEDRPPRRQRWLCGAIERGVQGEIYSWHISNILNDILHSESFVK